MKKTPLSVEEIKKLRRPLRNPNQEHSRKLSGLDLFAIWITEKVGTSGFFLVIFFWTLIWIGWNTLGPKEFQFDEYPSFVFWLLISNLIQILLMPLLLIGQNLQSKHSKEIAEADFYINNKAEGEIETILIHLENQNEMIDEIVKKLER